MKKKSLSILLALSLLLSLIPISASAAPADLSSYQMVVAADKAKMPKNETVTITVTVEGGAFIGADAILTYDDTLFEVVTAAPKWEKKGTNRYAYMEVNTEGLPAELGRFVFQAKTEVTEGTGAFTLSNAHLETETISGTEGNATPCPVSDPAQVVIGLRSDLDVQAVENVRYVYDGTPKRYTEVTSSTPGAEVRYRIYKDYQDEQQDPFALTYEELPTYTNVVDTPDGGIDVGPQVEYQVTAPGYEPKTGRMNILIEMARLYCRIVNYSGVYDGQPHMAAIYVEGLAPQDKIQRLQYDMFPGPRDSADFQYQVPVDQLVKNDQGHYLLSELPHTDAGEHVMLYSVCADGNYLVKLEDYYGDDRAQYQGARVAVNITKADMEEGVVTGNPPVSYDGQPHVSAVVSSAFPAGTVITYTWHEGAEEKTATEPPSFTEKGVYTVGWQSQNPNYHDRQGSYEFAVKMDMTGFEVKPNPAESYDGQPHASGQLVQGTPRDAVVTYTWTEGGEEKTCQGTPPTITEVGSYTISYRIEHPHYETMTGSYQYEVKKGGPIQASAEDVTVTYDRQPHNLQISANGFTPEEEARCVAHYKVGPDGQWTTELPNLVNAGTYTISWYLESPNYDKSPEYENTLTIEKRPATIDLDSGRSAYGQFEKEEVSNPERCKITGLVEGDTLDYKIICDFPEKGEEYPDLPDVGTYPIRAELGENPNYNVTVMEGTYEVIPLAVSIEIISHTKEVGEKDPELTYKTPYPIGGFKGDFLHLTLVREPGETPNSYLISVDMENSHPSRNFNYNGEYPGSHGYLTIEESTKMIEVVPDYVSGYSLILVYSNTENHYSYNHTAMYDVTDAGYTLEGTQYHRVYGLVVQGAVDESLVFRERNVSPKARLMYGPDVNTSGVADLRDAVAVVSVYNTDAVYMNDHMDLVLKADVSRDKKADASDFGLVKAEYVR